MEHWSASKIQKNYRIHLLKKNFIELQNLNLSSQFSQNSYDNVTKLLMKKDVLFIVNNFTKSFIKLFPDTKLNGRIFLLTYLISHHFDSIVPKKSLTPLDEYIFHVSNYIVNITDFNYPILVNLINQYFILYQKWIEHDKNRTENAIIISIHFRLEHLEELLEKEMDGLQKNDSIKTINDEISHLSKSLLMINKNFNLENLLQNHTEIYNSLVNSYEKIHNSVYENALKAFNDYMVEELSKGNTEILTKNFEEITNLIKLISSEKIEIPIPGEYNKETLTAYVNTIFPVIKDLGAVVDESTVNVNKEKSLKLLDTLQWEIAIPQIFNLINQSINIIIQRLQELSSRSD